MPISKNGHHVPAVPRCEVGPWKPSPDILPNLDGLIALCRDLAATDPQTGKPNFYLDNREFSPESRYIAYGRFNTGYKNHLGGTDARCLIEPLLWFNVGHNGEPNARAIDLPELLRQKGHRNGKDILSRAEAVEYAESLCLLYRAKYPSPSSPCAPIAPGALKIVSGMLEGQAF